MRLVFLLFVFCFSFICINHAQSGHEENRLDLPQSISEKDSTWRVVSFVFGYFPNMNDRVFNSPGFSAKLFIERESLISRFTGGWYAFYYTAFYPTRELETEYNRGVSLGRSLVIYDVIKQSKNKLKLKLGIGLTVLGRRYFGFSSCFSIHYTHLIGTKIKAGVSVSTECSYGIEDFNDMTLLPGVGLEINF